MLNNMHQPVFNGGDTCRISCLASAVQSAPHRKIELAAHVRLQAIYRGGIDKKSHNSASQFQPPQERFMKEKPNQHKAKRGQQSMSTTKLKVKGIFFDLDGTIVDSRDAYVEAARTAFQAVGQEPPEPKTALEIPRRLEQKQPLSPIVKGDKQKFLDVYLRTYYAISAEKTKPIPGIAATLETLSKKAKLALITMRNVPKQAVTTELEHFGIAKHFTHIITAMDTHKPKPSPEALIKTAKALDAQLCDCIIVGDSISDIKAGKAAGAKTVAVLTGLYTHKELTKQHPDLILKNATTLPNHIT